MNFQMPNPMVGEVFGSANMDVGIWDFNIGISNQLFLVYFYNLPTPNFPLQTFVTSSRRCRRQRNLRRQIRHRIHRLRQRNLRLMSRQIRRHFDLSC
jgi:hypothetical protein